MSFSNIPVAKTPAPGWKGGFSSSNSAFAYPSCDLSSLPMLHNMDNIQKLTREMDVLWPEFTWQTVPGDETSRCFRMFAPDISRVGYDDAGRIWSIICPQQGIYSPNLGTLNVEVSVTGQRGWVDETTKDQLIAADMSVTVQVWFSPSAKDTLAYNVLKAVIGNRPFPLDKASAIQVTTHHVGVPSQPNISVRAGTHPGIPVPSFADHGDEAWAVANVAVEIGGIQSLHDPMVDDFNAMIVDIFNLGSGNLLQKGNVLTWNVWVDAPTKVCRKEWKEHAEYWRHSIDAGHGSPDGDGSKPRYGDGSDFEPVDAVVQREVDLLKAWLMKHCPLLAALLPSGPPTDWGIPALESGPVIRTTTEAG